MWNKYFVRDQLIFGMLLGLLLVAISYGLLFLMDLCVIAIFNTHMLARQEYLYLLSLSTNLFAIKYYFVNLKYDKTGRGVLIVTFALALVYFVLV